MTMMHGGELIARALKIQGVETLYTLCGGHIAPIYYGCMSQNIRLIDFRHEQAAAHAADAHARLTRNIGVALVTAGPGVTGTVTAVANAYQARSPLIVIGGAAPTNTRGQGALQEIPQVEMFQRFTKASLSIEKTEDIPELMSQAIRLALSGRPGPIFIEAPSDVLFNAVNVDGSPEKFQPAPTAPPLESIQAMFDLLRKAQKPLIIAGTQVYWEEASGALRELTDQTGIPVFTNGGGRGTLSMTHPHCFKSARSEALREADVVLLIGTPLDFRLKYGQKDWNPAGKLIQIENDPAELNHNRQAEVAICADARLILEALAEGLQGIRFDPWLNQVRAVEDAKNAQLENWQQIDDFPVNHFRFGAALNDIIDEDTIVVADGGDVVGACAKVIDVTRPGQWLDPGPLGCLGVGVPFAIAAKHLFPEKKVLIISGDGSFGFNGFEIDTAVRFDLPMVCIVGNDAGWGQIRLPQIRAIGRENAIATDLAPTRYDRIVEAMGGYGEHVESPEGIIPALKRAFDSGKPACINVPLDEMGMDKTGASTPYII